MLSKHLVAPSRVASLMDWKSQLGCAVMALDISGDRIGVAVAGHPLHSDKISIFDPIDLNGRRGIRRTASSTKATTATATATSNPAAEELEEIVANERICAFVVRWPAKSGGRLDAKCGKVLHTLDNLLAAKKHSLIGKNRPFVLWNGEPESHVSKAKGKRAVANQKEEDVPDEWGRLASFGRSRVSEYDPSMVYSSKTDWCHSESSPEVTTDDSATAAKILQEFLEENFKIRENVKEEHKRHSGTASVLLTQSAWTTRRGSQITAEDNSFVAAQRNFIDNDGQAFLSQSLL